MTEKELKETGERMQAIRKKLGYRQNEFAKQLGISNASLSEIEAGNAKPRYELIYHITKKFKVNVYYLIHGRGDMFMPEHDSPAEKIDKLPQFKDWWEDFINHFNDSPMTRYAVMSYFAAYKTENDALIEKDMEKNRIKTEDKNDHSP